EQRVFPGAGPGQPAGGFARVRLRKGDQEVLGRDIFVPEVPRDLKGAVEDPRQLARRSRVGRGPRDLGLPVEVRFDLGRQSRRIDAELLKNRHDHAFALPEQGEQEVVRRQLGVAARAGVTLSFLDRLLGFDGELVESHVTNLSKKKPHRNGVSWHLAGFTRIAASGSPSPRRPRSVSGAAWLPTFSATPDS